VEALQSLAVGVVVGFWLAAITTLLLWRAR
jgi:hypothetical protein